MMLRLAVAFSFAATAVQAQPLPEDLQKATDCMVRVLTTTPGVSASHIDIRDNVVCLGFKPAEKNTWSQGMRFCLDPNAKSHKYIFWGNLPGLGAPKVSDNHVTYAVAERWNKRCGVAAIPFY